MCCIHAGLQYIQYIYIYILFFTAVMELYTNTNELTIRD